MQGYQFACMQGGLHVCNTVCIVNFFYYAIQKACQVFTDENKAQAEKIGGHAIVSLLPPQAGESPRTIPTQKTLVVCVRVCAGMCARSFLPGIGGQGVTKKCP